jgi:hypothetical protein
MSERGNRKYALPFENDRLVLASFAGGNWEEYGQIVLQMTILARSSPSKTSCRKAKLVLHNEKFGNTTCLPREPNRS